MGKPNVKNTDINTTIKHLEASRCQALLNADWLRLQTLLSDDLVHVHANGRVDDKASYLLGIREQVDFLKLERSDLVVSVYDAVAVVTGGIDQLLRVKADGSMVEFHGLATQVWVRHEDEWKQVSFHATRLN